MVENFSLCVPTPLWISYVPDASTCSAQVAAELADAGIKAAAYHADLDPGVRSRVHTR